MADKKNKSYYDELRNKAYLEIALRMNNQSSESQNPMTSEETHKIIHELQVHKIELEMQNDELLRIQNQLEESRLRYVDLYDFAPVGYLTITKNGLITEANYTAAKLLGVSKSELINKPFSRFIHNKYQDDYYFHGKQLLETNKQQAYEVMILPKNASPFWVHIETSAVKTSDGTIFFRTIISNIEEMKVSQRKIGESEERFRTLSETSLIGVSVSSAEGILLYCNRSFYQLLGYDQAELLGKRITDIYWDPKDRAVWMSKFFKDGFIQDTELRLKKKDGHLIWVDISASPISFDGAKAVMGTIMDISARKKSDDDLKRYAADLKASNKELEAFAYSLSHDLRAPLRTLDGFSQAVLEDYGGLLDAVGKDYLQRIRGGVQIMAQITEGMLNLSEVIRYRLCWETVSLSDIVVSIVKDLRENDPKRNVEFVISPGVFASGDPFLLRIALYNLIENAWKFTAKSPQPKIEFTSTEGEGTTVYLVRDNGIGIDMQYADNLFLPFQRLHASDYAGHGIGLATVQRVIMRHSGRIWTEAELGKGTTIYFTLSELISSQE